MQAGSIQEKRKKIVHLRNCRGIMTLTGPETYLLDLARNIDTRRFDVYMVITVNRFNSARLFLDLLRETEVKLEVIRTNSLFDFSDLRYLRRSLGKEQPGLLVTHDMRSDIVAWLANIKKPTRWIAFAHGWLNWERIFSKHWLYSRLEKLAVQHADAVQVASQHMYRNLLKLGISKEKIHCIPIGIDVESYASAGNGPKVRSELGVAPEALIVGLVGRIHPWKGQEVLIEAAARVLEACPNTHFLLVGDIVRPEQRAHLDALRMLAQQLNIARQVQFVGTRSDIPDIMQLLDICVVPSLREPYGLVAIEAQAAGTPVIASNVGGLREIVQDGVSGCLVPPGDSIQLANAIVMYLRDANLRSEVGMQGRKRANKEFSYPTMVSQTEALYEQMAPHEA